MLLDNSKMADLSLTPSKNVIIVDQESEVPDLLDFNLSLTYEERLLNHQRALDTIKELIKARKQIYGELEFTSETSSR